MNIVREHINFERGLDPKEAMKIGLSDEEILDAFINSLKEFDIDQIRYKWDKYDEEFEIFYIKKDKEIITHTVTYILCTYKDKRFDVWQGNGPTKSYDQAKHDILKLILIDKNLHKNSNKIKKYLENYEKI
jgi:hypothetical protein